MLAYGGALQPLHKNYNTAECVQLGDFHKGRSKEIARPAKGGQASKRRSGDL